MNMKSSPLVKPTGFREYDARWLLEKEINLMGIQALGMGLGTLIREMGVKPEIVTGHDFRTLFRLGEDGADHRAAGVRLQGARHRACASRRWHISRSSSSTCPASRW